MSQVLVESLTIPPTFGMPSIDPHEHCHEAEVSLEERKMVMQLACMASQHPSSEYNRMKFGPPIGPPVEYIPMSIQFPAQVRDMKSRQTANAKSRVWWPATSENRCTRPISPLPYRFASQYASCMHINEEEARKLKNKSIPPIHYHPAVDLQFELSVAMSSSLSLITIPSLSVQAKTSQSHPINISAIVPSELLPLITSHLEPTFNRAAHLFNLPPSLLLHRLLFLTPTAPETAPSYPFMRIYDRNVNGPVNGAGPPDVALFPPPPLCPRKWQTPMMNGDPHKMNRHATEVGNLGNSDGVVVFGAASRERPPHLFRPSLSPPPLSELVQAMSSDIFRSLGDAEKESFKAVRACGTVENSMAEYVTPPLLPTLGNMLLSSCPGKKVRLSGPVRGRGAIFRDLGHDLRRIKSLGVGCIICCLDDEELDFLGAPWPEYSEIAGCEGLDILRIPIPEGLAPLSPSSLDQQLSHLIHAYTLKGISVLVHCRGGVGRAGLIACCWMLKLGLCGWLSDSLGDANGDLEGGSSKVRKDTLELVQRVIAVARRRRSSKAIETYEQVKFLVEFVEFMRENGSRVL